MQTKTLTYSIITTVLFTMALGACSSPEEEEALDEDTLLLVGLASAASASRSTSTTFSVSYDATSTTYAQNEQIQTNNASVSGGTAASFSATNMPAGLSINSSTGAITGTPTTVSSTNSTTIVATSTTGQTSTRTLSLDVAATVAAVTCNTNGTGAGCSASFPFTCPNATVCLSTYSACRSNSACNYYY